MITFSDPENLFNKPIPSIDSPTSDTTFGEVLAHIERNMLCTLTMAEGNRYFHVNKPQSFFKNAIDSSLRFLSGSKSTCHQVDIHIIRDSKEICPKHNISFSLRGGDTVILRQEFLIC